MERVLGKQREGRACPGTSGSSCLPVAAGSPHGDPEGITVWGGLCPRAFHLPVRDGFQAWNAHPGTGKSTANLLERRLEKQDLVKRPVSVLEWAAGQHWGCVVHSWLSPHICSTASQGKRVKESFGGHLGRNGQQLAVPGPGSTGWVLGHTLSSGLPQQKSQPFVGKMPPLSSWVIQKPQSVPAQHPEVFTLGVEVAAWNSQQHTETQKGFLSWLLSHVASRLLKGRLPWVHPGLPLRQGAGLPPGRPK